MGVYWFGGEDIDFTLVGNAIGGGGNFDANFCRAVVQNNIASTTWPLVNSASNPLSFGNLSSFWFHASVGFQNNPTSANAIFLAFADSAGVARILVRATGVNGQLKLSSRNAAGTIVDFPGATSTLTFPLAGPTKFDVFINYSASGQVTLYQNGLVAADTGAGVNVTTDSATALSFFYLGTNTTGSSLAYFSQVIVADTDTRAAGVLLLNSATAGNAQTWTGTASNVNKSVINDTTFISAASAGLIEEFKTGGIAFPAGTWSVAAVKMSSRAQGGSAGGPTRVAYVTRVGSTDYVGGTWTPPVGGFANDTQNYIQATNPATGLPWVPADLTAATFNYGIESVA